ncbi:hypothetical protein VTN49DRAFT_6924 [Thermomyces lanuginosus]|uniref:uncharacterized protein n=1 Tax=Thermomyces lanuginosus TaxID=5541 RepID=UPI0037447F7E
MASAHSIPQFLLPRGISPQTLRFVATTARRQTGPSSARRTFTTTSSWRSSSEENPRLLEKPDKFRPPSHPSRRVVQLRNGKLVNPAPYNYPGPPLSAKEKEEQKTKRYPHMFPPEGTVMHKFLTTRWIHAWIAMGVLTSLAFFTFTENFKRTSPFAHLLPSWSGLLSHPIDTIAQALNVYRMHVEHESQLTRERRHRRVEDAEKRRQFRIAHGLEEPEKNGSADVEDDQSPIAKDADVSSSSSSPSTSQGSEPLEYRDFSGQVRPVKKWLGIW